MGNFTYLLENKNYRSFAPACVNAEDSFAVSTISAMMMTRRAMELATKWVYSVDEDLTLPYRDNLSTLLADQGFVDILDSEIPPLLNYIRKIGNLASHSNVKISREESVLALNYLFQYTQWIDYVYGEDFAERYFDEGKVPSSVKFSERPLVVEKLAEETSGEKDRPLEDLRREVPEETRRDLTENRREVKSSSDYSFELDKIDEAKTRKLIIDIGLRLAGWKLNENVELERKVSGMPNKGGTGFVDYLLLGKNGLPLAVVEAKRTMVDPSAGREQAKIYGDLLKGETGQAPLIFYTNGFDTWFIEDDYPPRKVSGFYSQDELQRLVDRRRFRETLADVSGLIDDDISGRYYQKAAIVNVAEAFENKRRKALLVMATGERVIIVTGCINALVSRVSGTFIKNNSCIA